MPIRRRENGQWLIDIRTVDGHRIRKTVDGDLKRAEVQTLEAQLRTEAGRQTLRRRAQPVVAELFARYWEEHGQHLAAWANERSHLDRWSDALGDDTRVSSITPGRVAEIIAYWRTTPIASGNRRKPRIVANSTINQRLSCLQQAFGRAEELWGWVVPRIPWRRLKLDKPSYSNRALTQAQRRAYLDALPERSKAVTLLALYTGLRRSAILRLTKRDLDFERRMIYAISKGRGGGKPTPVPMTKATDAVFAMMGDLPEVGRIFTITPARLRDDRLKARKAAGLSSMRFHDLRHTFAQHLEDAGAGDLITDALHHSDPRLRRRYAEARATRTRQGLDRLFRAGKL